MDKEERLTKQIKTIYTEIARRLVDPSFSFPEGGQAQRQLSKFIVDFTQICGGEFNISRLVDYCVFQLHKNRNAQYQRTLAPKAFGPTALQKYLSMYSKSKVYSEDKWLSEAQLTREYLNSLVNKREHPQAKYIYMPSEECTKKRGINTDIGFVICSTSTLMWSPFSPACQMCMNVEKCKQETAIKYPELYRIRLEEYGKRR